MPKLQIQQTIWDGLVAVAQKQKREPETLVEEALKDYLDRANDEELLERSAKAARRAPFRIEETEEIVRQHRGKKKN
jgi:hypothetical protein